MKEYPYLIEGHMYQYDLHWIIENIQNIWKNIDASVELHTIKYADPIQWDITTQYQANTVVVDPKTGTAYISTKPVPAGILLTDTNYWTVVFNFQKVYTDIMKNIASHYEEGKTATSVLKTYELVWVDDILYYALHNINIGDAYVPDANIKQTTVEEMLKISFTENMLNFAGGNRTTTLGNDTLTVSGDYTVTAGDVSLTAENTYFDGGNVTVDNKNPIAFKNIKKGTKYNGIPLNKGYILIGNELNIDDPFIDVSSLGVIPNSNLDQTTIINQILSNHKYLIFPEGTYNVNKIQISGDNKIIWGLNATFVSNTENSVIEIKNFHNSKIIGFSIQHTSTNEQVDTILLDGCNNCTFNEIHINPCAYVGIHAKNVHDTEFEEILIKNYGRVGVYTEQCSHLIVNNSKIIGDKGVSVSHCLQFNRGSFNTVQNSILQNAGHFCISLVDENKSTAINNFCENSCAEAVNLEGCEACTVSHNKCIWDLTTSTDFGISVYGPSQPSIRYANLNSVIGNYINNCGKAGIALADNCLFNMVANNIINNGNLKKVTDVDGMVTVYGEASPNNNSIVNNLGTGDGFNFLYKQNNGSNNFISGNYMLNKKPSKINNVSNILQNPQLTWVKYTPTVRASDGTITQSEFVKSEYAYDGDFIRLNIILHIINNGTGDGILYIGLPFAAKDVIGVNCAFTAGEPQKTGSTLGVFLSQTEMGIRKYDSSYPGQNDARIMITGYYEANH